MTTMDTATETHTDTKRSEDAAVKLYVIALALAEAADRSLHAPILRSLAAAVRDRAESLCPDADSVVREIALGLLTFGRRLLGTPFGGSSRLDYLLYYIANADPDWMQPLRRRQSWLDEARRATQWATQWEV